MVKKHKDGDEKALSTLIQMADQGDAFAQVRLADDVYGEAGDFAEAAKWFRKAAEQGNAKGQYNLGRMYSDGRGVPQSDAEAVNWYRKAAEQGQADAQDQLANLYDHGNGVPQDFAEAVKWRRKAAEQGNTPAQFNLAIMYADGRGVPQDFVQAYKWMRLTGASQNSIKNLFKGMTTAHKGTVLSRTKKSAWFPPSHRHISS